MNNMSQEPKTLNRFWFFTCFAPIAITRSEACTDSNNVSLSVELANCVGLVLLGGVPPLGSVLPKECCDGVVRRLRLSEIHVTPGILTDQRY